MGEVEVSNLGRQAPWATQHVEVVKPQGFFHVSVLAQQKRESMQTLLAGLLTDYIWAGLWNYSWGAISGCGPRLQPSSSHWATLACQHAKTRIILTYSRTGVAFKQYHDALNIYIYIYMKLYRRVLHGELNRRLDKLNEFSEHCPKNCNHFFALHDYLARPVSWVSTLE